MLARFADAPGDVLADFRRRCGDDTPVSILDINRLQTDLEALRDWDCRAQYARMGLPVLVLHGEADPILPPAMRDAVFASASRVDRITRPEAGHLLPLTDPGFCAEQIRRFVELVR
jgi:pimeloyl-[acyl-carrier protein] methyl ester esterase